MGLFVANMWDELLSERGLEQLEHHFGMVQGNWLSGARQSQRPTNGDDVLISPSTMESAVTPRQGARSARTMVGWVLFPDQVIGWDFDVHRYRHQVAPVLADTLELTQSTAVNSAYTARELYRAGAPKGLPVVPLGVDIHGITRAMRHRSALDSHEPHIFWGHMWRTQKDPEAALRIAIQLLYKAPTARITIGRAESWADPEHSPPAFQTRLRELVAALRERGGSRVSVIPHFHQPADYWRFLGGVDISYTWCREESFGVALLEHAAAGAACVAPRILCYPDVHRSATLVPYNEGAAADAIALLAADPHRLSAARTACRAAAARYDVRRMVEEIIELFHHAAHEVRS
jgi:hypothetical protein